MFKKLPNISYQVFKFLVFFLLVTGYWSLVTSHFPVFASETPSFIKVEDLGVSDTVFINQDGESLKQETIVEKKWVEEPVEVYNLTVGGNETYFANDLAVHNKGTDHYAYFFFDSNGNGFHNQGEAISSSPAYTIFFSPCEEGHSETKPHKLNDDSVTHRWWNEGDPEVAGSNDARMGLTGASQYGCGPAAYAIPQTNWGSPYYPGGVRFKDYDGTPRPAYKYKYLVTGNANDENCSGDESRLTYTGSNFSNDWKPEKEYRGTGSGFNLTAKGDYLLQVAEFTVDYTGSYYLKVLDGGGMATIAPKTRDVNMPVGWIDQNTINWSDYQQDNSYASYTPTIRQINAYCTSSDCGEGMITDDNKYYNRGKSGTQYELDYYNTTWSGFSDITDAANQAFASFGGTANVKDIMVWSQPQWQCGGECGLACSAGHQWLITKDNPPRAFSRSRSCNGSWSSFADVTSGANGELAFLGGLNNVKSRDISCSRNSCTDRILTHGNQVWQRTASVTGTFGCATSCGGDCNRCFNWTWGSFSDVTSGFNQAVGVVGLTVGDVEDMDRFCVDEPSYGWGWKRRYCKDTIITTDGRAFFREYKKLNEWWAIGAGESVCSGGGWSTPPGSCYLEKDKAYLMILSAHTDVRDDCYVYNSSSGFPFLFWRGGQEIGSPNGDGWYSNNHTSAIPIAASSPGVSGRVYADANQNCSDNSENGVAGAKVYLDSWGSSDQATTLSDGSFSLEGVSEGSHNLFIQPATDYQVGDCVGTDPELKFDGSHYYKTIVVPVSGVATTDFALVRTGSIFGHVYEHSDASATCATLETTNPVEGITVRSTDGSLSDTTNSEGYFNLGTEIPARTYVLEIDPATLAGYSLSDILYCPAPPGRSLTISADSGGDYEVDIGLLSSLSWFQVKDGDTHAEGIISSSIPATATEPFFDLDGDGGTPGVVSYGGSSADFGEGSVSAPPAEWLAQTAQTRKLYSYFYRLLGSPTDETFDGTLPSGDGVYYAGSGQTLSGDWTLPVDRKIVVLVDGDLKVGVNIDVLVGSSLVMVVSGGINFTETTIQVEGIFLANGTIDTGSASEAFVGEGSFVAGGFSLNRDFGDGRNNTTPVEQFLFRPDILLNSLTEIWPSAHTWEELAP